MRSCITAAISHGCAFREVLVTETAFCILLRNKEFCNLFLCSKLHAAKFPSGSYGCIDLEEFMRFFRLHGWALVLTIALALGFSLQTFDVPAYSQETTGGLQGTVKDPSGAVIAGAQITATAPTLVGSKVVVTDSAGYYRFANLPPGTYTIEVKASGFDTLKRSGLNIEVGHLPTLNLALAMGQVNTVVQVTTDSQMIDTTTTTTLTNIAEETLKEIPHGTSFQSVIQFAPAARNEPLAGGASFSNGSGGTSPGNGGNGGQFGFSIGGGSDSENSYLVEGQETANLIGGYSHTNVPMDFIQEVQLKTSGVEAEYGGALGGVVNVIMDKGTNQWHGSVYTSFQDQAMDGSPVATARYDPNSSATSTSWGKIDPTYQNYQPVRPKSSDFWPGATLGGPLVGLIPGNHFQSLRDRIFLFAGFNPEFNAYERKLNFGPTTGIIPFSQNTHTFYSNARIDAEVTPKVRVFGSWLYQGQRQAGESLPSPDSVQGYINRVTGCQGLGSSVTCPLAPQAITNYSHSLGYSAPNTTLNTGADITISNSLVATTRFGYYFENYHDFGYETSTPIYVFEASGAGAKDGNGNLLSVSAPALNQANLYQTQNLNQNFTHLNASKAIQLDQDIAWFHSGKAGTHNVKAGYQLNRNSNYIFQAYNAPEVQIFPGDSSPYDAGGPVGNTNCAPFIAKYGTCMGLYGVVNVNDFGSGGKATSYNHGFFGQDAWTVGKGLTINFGVRLEREYLPAENQPSGTKITTPINFGWGDKIAPRIGAAWDVWQNGKMKVFGGFGQYFDQMKLNVAISSYGGQYWQECYYALNVPTYTGVVPAYDKNNRYCAGQDSSSPANLGTGASSAVTFLENINQRAFPTTCITCSSTQEGTAPGLKPYAQHDSNLGVAYQIKSTLAFEARWDRRRLDHVIEDSAIYDSTQGETFVIVNPGEGVNSSFNKFYNFLYGMDPPACSGLTCANQTIVPPARSYDGLELRISKAQSKNWTGMFSYTYSHLRGNYTGLTSTDIADGGAGGRNAPNNSRAFDEPYFSYNAMGGSSSGLLPTDRPNALKGYVYYTYPWLRKFATDFGIFQSAYSGTPLTSYVDVGTWSSPGAYPVDIVNRGKWIDVKQDPNTGVITASAPYTRRTSWYTSSDLNVKQTYKIGESKSLSFDATLSNALNQHAVVARVEQIDSQNAANYISPNGARLADGVSFYGGAEHAYDYVAGMNLVRSNVSKGSYYSGPMTIDSQYGQPLQYQVGRNIRLALHFTF